MGWPWAYDTLIRELKRVRPEWIDFESTQGQRTPYVFRWTGLAVRREGDLELGQDSTSARLPHDFRKRAPQEPPQTGSAEADEAHDPNGKTPPHEPPHDSDGSPLPLTSTESSEVNAASEEKLDPVVGKTTAAKPEPEFPELLDRLEPNPFHENGGLLLSDDEIAELGTLPLEELHRRRERGEL